MYLMTDKEKQTEQDAVRWIRKPVNKRAITEKFASLDQYHSSSRPMYLFTAGSPGAGKTEFIRGFQEVSDSLLSTKPVVIDPDAIRELLPGYDGSNSYLFQRAISIAVEDLYRHVLKNKQSAFIDGTFADYNHAHMNIQKAIDRSGSVMICYVFQHPSIAWHFTQLREAVEGRRIREVDFVQKFIDAKNTVDKVKDEFGDQVSLSVILKDYKDTKENKQVAQVFNDAASIDDCIPFDYTKESIKKAIS